MVFLALPKGEKYTLKPDGFSYIIYSVNSSCAFYYRPFLHPITLTSEAASKYYIFICRPTYVGRLIENKLLTSTKYSLQFFLNQLESEKFRNIYPSVIDSILFHLHFNNGDASIDTLKKRYHCTSAYINNSCKYFLGLTFTQYQGVLLSNT